MKQQQDKSDKNFSLMNLGAQIVSAVADTARGFITEVYRDEIGGIDDEMYASEKRYETGDEEAEEELEQLGV